MRFERPRLDFNGIHIISTFSETLFFSKSKSIASERSLEKVPKITFCRRAKKVMVFLHI